MNRQPHPDPSLARAGVTIEIAKGRATTARALAPEHSAQNELIKQLPENRTYTTGFESISVPAAEEAAEMYTTAAKTMPAWYLLGRLTAMPGRELFLNSIEVTQGSADVMGTAASDALGWSDVLGRGAAIVIGPNVFGASPNDNALGGRWSFRPFVFPGFFGSHNVNTLAYTNHAPFLSAGDYLYARDWSTGRASDVQPSKWAVPKHYGATGFRIGPTTNLDVCLVLRQGTINAEDHVASKTINGHCIVQLFTAMTTGSGTW